MGGKIQYIINGASAINIKIVHFMHNIGIPVYEGYGATETTAATVVNTPRYFKVGSVGRAVSGVKLRIDASESNTEKEGEIIIYGDSNMKEYFHLPEKTAQVFTEDRGYRSGDTGYIDDEEFLFVTGRKSDHYKLENGKFVSPVPIEEHITLLNEVKNCLLYGYNKPFNIVILSIDSRLLTNHLKKMKLKLPLQEAIKDPRVKEYYLQQMQRFCGSFKSFEIPKHCILSLDDWTQANDFVTPTLKVKRKNIVSHFQKEIDAIYSSDNMT